MTKEGLPDAGKQDLMANLFFLNQFNMVAAMYSYCAGFYSCLEPLGQEGKSNARFWGCRIQEHAVCGACSC
jgi:hypothetical protein